MKKNKKKTSIRHCVALILCAALYISVREIKPSEVQAGQETQQTKAPEQLFHICQTVTENGRIIYQKTDSDIMQIKDAFLYELENAEAVHRQKRNEGTEFISSDTIYSSEGYAMTSTKNRYSGTLVAEQDIQISGHTSKLDNSSIYSKNGDILISGHTVEIHGIVYAPLGSVKINCETMILKGVLIADSAEINAGNCQYQPDETILQNVKRMAEYQVDSHADITMYYDNEKNKIGIEEIAGKDISLYTRYGNGAFQLQENYTNGTLFDLPDKGEYFEAYAKFTDPYGEQKLSDIETFGSTEEGIYGPMTQDKDKDGIPDGYEVRDGLGDPSKRNSENMGMSDGEAVLLYGNRHAMGNLEANIFIKDAVWKQIAEKYGKRLSMGKDNLHNYPIKAGDSVQIYYNEDGKKVISVYNVILQKHILECVGNTYILQFYDLDGNTLVKLAYDGNNQLYNAYTYNENGVETILHNGIRYSYSYDDDGQIENVSMNGECAVSYQWINDKKCIQTMANGFHYIIEYNEINQKTRVSSDDEVLYEWKYCNEKPYYLLKHIDHVNHLEYDYKYDEQGEVSQVSCNNGTTYYTDNGVTEWVVKTTEEDKKEEETYQILGDDYIYTNGDIKASSNESAQIIYVDDENISTTKVISENDNEKQITQNGSIWHYVYDEQGLLKELQKDGELSCRYEYNNLNELVREDSALTGKTMLYQYDGGGNIQTAVSYPLNTVKAKEQFTGGTVESQYEYDKDFPDRLIAFQGKKITYDKMGNPLDYWNGYHFAWTQGQRLETICHGDNRYCYSYDMDGYRMSKTINGTKTCFTYQNGTLTIEKSANHEMRYHYDAGNHLLYFEYNDKPYYYELDDYNTVVGILNEQGERLVSYEYDAWGKVLNISGDRRLGERNPFRYRSYYYDKESGFYYLHNRYYDPEVRRMLNMDSYTDTQFGMLSHNMYAYCENTPVNASNYSGNIPAWVKKLEKSPSGKNYLWKTNSVYSETNCYGYAVKYDKKGTIHPGHFTGKSFRFDRITDYTKADLKKKFNHSRQVTYEESNALPKKYVVIALRMGKTDTGGSDYHYMRRLYDSKSKTLIWTHKPGTGLGGVLIHKYWPAKLNKWPFEAYNKDGQWQPKKPAGGYTGMICYYAYWN